MEPPTPPGPNSSGNTNPRKTNERSAQFCCQRCNRYFSNLQGFNRHRNVHLREEMEAILRHQAFRSYVRRVTHSIRLQYSSIYQRRFQPRFQPGSYYAQTMNGLASRDGLIVNVSYPPPNFSSSLFNNGINLNVGAPGNMIHAMAARGVIANPNLVMPVFVPASNYYGNVTMMPTPSAGEGSGGNRMVIVVNGSSGVGAGEEEVNRDVDLNLHL